MPMHRGSDRGRAGLRYVDPSFEVPGSGVRGDQGPADQWAIQNQREAATQPNATSRSATSTPAPARTSREVWPGYSDFSETPSEDYPGTLWNLAPPLPGEYGIEVVQDAGVRRQPYAWKVRDYQQPVRACQLGTTLGQEMLADTSEDRRDSALVMFRAAWHELQSPCGP